MGKALFLGLSAAFFIAYSLIATALLVNTDTIAPPTTGNSNASTQEQCEGFPPSSFHQFLLCSGWNNIPGVGDVLQGTDNVLQVAGTLFSGFLQLISFNAGLPAASFVTLLIFGPLAFINAYIVFTAIRGSS